MGKDDEDNSVEIIAELNELRVNQHIKYQYSRTFLCAIAHKNRQADEF